MKVLLLPPSILLALDPPGASQDSTADPPDLRGPEGGIGGATSSTDWWRGPHLSGALSHEVVVLPWEVQLLPAPGSLALDLHFSPPPWGVGVEGSVIMVVQRGARTTGVIGLMQMVGALRDIMNLTGVTGGVSGGEASEGASMEVEGSLREVEGEAGEEMEVEGAGEEREVEGGEEREVEGAGEDGQGVKEDLGVLPVAGAGVSGRPPD